MSNKKLKSVFSSRPKCETSFPDGAPCDLEGIAKADPASCAAYYQCVSGCVEHRVCPGGEVFSDLYMECEARDTVSCGQRPCEEEANCGGDTSPTNEPGDCTPEDQWIDCSQTGDLMRVMWTGSNLILFYRSRMVSRRLQLQALLEVSHGQPRG